MGVLRRGGALRHTTWGEVYPGTGLGSARLGMSRAEVEACLGAAERAIERDEDGDAVLEYPGGAYLYFDHERDFRLTLILLEDPGALQLGSGAPGRVRETQVLARLGDPGCVTVDETSFIDERGRADLDRSRSFRDLGLTVHTDRRGRVTACAIFVLYDEEDRVRWPEAAAGSR